VQCAYTLTDDVDETAANSTSSTRGPIVVPKRRAVQ
jgi:hypothetical protein